jgi:hypothetical protein
MVVCTIAYTHLTPVAKAKVDQLLALRSYNSFAQACNYPDTIQQRLDEHYVNYPRTQQAVTGIGCGIAAPTICVIDAIRRDRATLSAPGTSPTDRSYALLFLSHWVGDIHQPLHVSFGDDRGGGRTDVTGPCILVDPARRIARDSNVLHRVWDTCILQVAIYGPMGLPETTSRNRLSNAVTAAGRIDTPLSGSQRAAWTRSEPWEWAKESFEIAIAPDVNYCIRRGGACWYDETRQAFAGGTRRSILIDDSYLERYAPIVRERIHRAGIRLAHMLNDALDPACRRPQAVC